MTDLRYIGDWQRQEGTDTRVLFRDPDAVRRCTVNDTRVLELDLDDLRDVDAADDVEYQRCERLMLWYAAEEERLRPAATSRLGTPVCVPESVRMREKSAAVLRELREYIHSRDLPISAELEWRFLDALDATIGDNSPRAARATPCSGCSSSCNCDCGGNYCGCPCHQLVPR